MKLRGWTFVLLVTAILSVWALRLAFLTPTSKALVLPEDVEGRQDLVRKLLERLPVNVLERFLQSLDQEPRRLDAFGYLPWDGLDTVVAVGEPREARLFWRQALERVATTGARMVWIPGYAGDFTIPELGLEFGLDPGRETRATPGLPLPLLAGVREVRLRDPGSLTRLATPVVRLLEGESGGVHAVLVRVGNGEVVVLAAPHIADLEDIRHADNALLLASLARRDAAPRPRVGMIRATETARELILTALAERERQLRLELRDTPLLSLWSMVVANPSCLVLLQLLLVVLVHVLSVGRDLPGSPGRPVAAREELLEEGLVDLFRRTHRGHQVLLSAASIVFRRRLPGKLGVAPETDVEELERLLATRDPASAGRLTALVMKLKADMTRPEGLTREDFVRRMQQMERVLEEARP